MHRYPIARLRTARRFSGDLCHQSSHKTNGVRAAGRTFGKSHTTMMRWEKHLADQAQSESPLALAGSDVTVEGEGFHSCG